MVQAGRNLYDGMVVEPIDDGYRVLLTSGPKGRTVAELEILYRSPPTRRRPGSVSSIRFESTQAITAQMLQHLAWGRYLGVVQAKAVYDTSPGPDTADEMAQAASQALGGARAAPVRRRRKRPGRRGHDTAFYGEIARMYKKAVLSASSSPTLDIARARHVSRNTAAGWVMRARKLGYLPPAQKGRAG